MAKLQDNELDALFRQAAEQTRVSPSVSVWGRVEAELARSKGQRWLGYVWNLRIAASVLLFVAFGSALYQDYGSIEVTQTEPVDYEALAISMNLLPDLSSTGDMDPKSEPVKAAATLPGTQLPVRQRDAVSQTTTSERPSLRAIQPVLADVSSGTAVQTPEPATPILASTFSSEEQVRTPASFERSLSLTSKKVRSLSSAPAQQGLQARKTQMPPTELAFGLEEVSRPAVRRWYASVSALLFRTDASFEALDLRTDYLYSNDQTHILSVSSELISSDVQYQAGLRVAGGFRISSRISVVSGIDYRYMRGSQAVRHTVEEQRTYTESREYPVPQNWGNNAPAPDRLLVDEEVVQTSFRQDTLRSSFVYQSFEIPLQLRLEGRRGKWSWYAMSGASVSLVNSMQINAYSESLPHVREDKLYYTLFAPLEVNWLGGVGISYFILPNVSLHVQPEFRYAVPTGENQYLRRSYSTYQVGTGFSFFF